MKLEYTKQDLEKAYKKGYENGYKDGLLWAYNRQREILNEVIEKYKKHSKSEVE